MKVDALLNFKCFGSICRNEIMAYQRRENKQMFFDLVISHILHTAHINTPDSGLMIVPILITLKMSYKIIFSLKNNDVFYSC